MIKRFAVTALLAGLSVAAAPAVPASAADCGVLALLSPCVPAPQPAPQPTPLPLPPLPLLTPAPAPPPPAPEPVAPPAPVVAPPPPAAPAPASRQPGPVPAAAERLQQLVNQERVAARLQPLAADARLASIAAGHSTTMAGRGDIFHNAAYFTAATRRAVGAGALGENVAMNSSIDAAHRRLMASPGHRANILNGSFDAAGMAVVQDAAGTLFVTQNFADLQGGPAPRPAAAPAARTKAAPTGSPGAVLRVASAPAPAAAPPAAPAPPAGAVLEAQVAGPVEVALGPSGPASAPSGPPMAAVALTLLTTVGAAALRAGATALRWR